MGLEYGDGEGSMGGERLHKQSIGEFPSNYKVNLKQTLEMLQKKRNCKFGAFQLTGLRE